MLGLHNLKTSQGAKTKKRRLGRGNASGRGNYSGRGMKGQKARSGGKSGLTLRGVKTYIQRIPKQRGFNSSRPKKEEVSLGTLSTHFESGQIVTPRALLNKGLIRTVKNGVKILGVGTINKKLNVQANAFSKKAQEEIIKAGGQAEIIVKKLKETDNKTANKSASTK
ncbi:MAG: 50S ribosomal protein L15 [Candidatus Komeilibacteria bacterium CG10_big_fil_rev_8_21_14_0_10_41_13]|uniref:Large ribosomal subunit protein uL15 n=1 Tax=Candidatus Komeilibacteria bacterium CG10_big_fil_rev_8_21_14_0_10_41_13 TaxID=1974476 RepID=A0A2M6WDF2_9BACT|nr:MAG: 50S ribosomal protein L15 [Candidatus Komeilibacteria bacterium CG10_big_fil_rev_8_21_14_0_10_41_13]